MQKIPLIMFGAVCSFGLFSCSEDPALDATQQAVNRVELRAGGQINNGTLRSPSLVAPNAELVSVADGFGFTEGPAVDSKGNVFFTDQPNDLIYKWSSLSGELDVFLEGTGRSNGMAFDKDGNLIACADLHGELWKIYPDGSHDVLVDNYNGKLLNGPNDVWINPENGGMYITDPIFPRDYWDEDDPRKQDWPPTHSEQAATGKGGHVYYLAPGATELVRVTTMAGWNDDSWPNGVVGSPDGTKLYVNQWNFDGTGGVWSFDINVDGTLTNIADFVPGLNFCDGMSMDEMGNVYVSARPGISIYDPLGTSILDIDTGGSTNNVFGGRNNKTLFITGPSNAISTLQMTIKGSQWLSRNSN